MDEITREPTEDVEGHGGLWVPNANETTIDPADDAEGHIVPDDDDRPMR